MPDRTTPNPGRPASAAFRDASSGGSTPTILVVGGYGAFGVKVAERLAREAGITIVLAGRNEARAREAASQLATAAVATITFAVIDAMRPDAAALRGLAPTVIINASGPYQAQDYSLAHAAIAAGSHYIDLADARDFVTGIGALDAAAKAGGVLVTSGASSVPALAAAIVDSYAGGFAAIDTIEHCITPANGYDPGISTTASILGGVGKPLTFWHDGAWRLVYGWQGLRRTVCPGLGARWMADCDVPDLELFPRRYAGVQTVRFQAGLEVPMFQFGLWVMAWMVRAGLLRRPDRLAVALMWIKRRLSFLGSGEGGLFVFITGRMVDGSTRRIAVSLIARQNQGPYVPAIASVVLARALIDGRQKTRGAMPCVGLIRLEDYEREVADLPITISVDDAGKENAMATARGTA